mgnify:FL=1
MIAKCGTQKQHHFAHKPILELNDKERNIISNCINSNESYLHNAFKIGLYQILKAKIENNEEFIIHWNASNIGEQNCNLLKIAKNIKIENYVYELKPDITLYDKNGRAYVAIEIVVQHKPDRKKLAYYSENKISLYEIDLDKNNLPVFYLKNSRQIFRANRYVHFKNNLDKARIIFSKTSIDTIIGFENGNFCIIDENGFASEEESFLAQCVECKKYYFTTNNSDWTCKHCGYYDGDRTFCIIGTGEDEIFNNE